MDPLPIGQVAKATGTTVSTLRYYDDIELVIADERVGGKRHYHPDKVRRVELIRQARHLGFSLEDIREVLDPEDENWTHLVDAQLTELRDRQRKVAEMINVLETVKDCGCASVATCTKVRRATC